ncbi:DUF2913 family protein [Vibrio salinus]|uniref:DUF2913 family protein n=1 Tax=Vibrio salinus TaxID=2899784 RepID=UPI001E54BA73|nr:DUF2913 family protein [Vibrio salinus]MCE0492620.1 DUF2913 family protein [Vibrio salinus]
MTQYYCEIQTLVNQALNDMAQQHRMGKLVNSPVSNNHYLVRWITKSLKQHTFSRVVNDDLIRWQKAGRSKGTAAALPILFQRISSLYQSHFVCEKEITDKQIEAFLDQLESLDWEVSTSEPITGQGKVQLFTERPDSVALCATQCESCFDGEVLVEPMSWFVRGNHRQFISLAWKAGLLVHKKTDYKSSVKYHGEYWIFPQNKGEFLAEIPDDFSVDS